MKIIDLTGQRFGKLVVIRAAGIAPDRRAMWEAVCDCGKTTIVSGSVMRVGNTKSCGCLRREVGLVNGAKRKRHGMTKTRTHAAWQNMHRRCTSPNDISYKNYGGRGVCVCERWQSFESFFDDMGKAPEGMSLDRINVDGNYEPSNCKWSTDFEQQRNTRVNYIIHAFGKSLTLIEWSEFSGIQAGTIARRIKRGWHPERAIKTPAVPRW